MTTSTEKPSDRVPAGAAREWMPHIWEGCDFFAWMRLLARNRFAVGWRQLYVALIVTLVSLTHTLLRWLQEFWYSGRIQATVIREDPIFIIGHWRAGTTLLHELLVLDQRHTFPTTYECLAPNHFLLSEHLFTRWLPFLMPSRRPMDNMAAGWDRPQEDEFALCMLGQPSPYLKIAFPNRPLLDPESLDLERLPPRRLVAWKRAYVRYLKTLTFRDPRRLVLKSPTHTCRIKVLLELFPRARFIHIVRNPYAVFPSTVNLWKSLYETHGLQTPTFAGLDEEVFETFTHLYQRLEAGRLLVEPSRFHEIRYEDLVHDAIGQMRSLYEHLSLDGFNEVLPRLREYLEKTAGYRTNRYEHSPKLLAEIARRWGAVIARYGYESPPVV